MNYYFICTFLIIFIVLLWVIICTLAVVFSLYINFLLYLIFASNFGNCLEIVGFATIVGFSRWFSPTHLLTSSLPRSARLPSPNRFLLRSPLLLFSQRSYFSCVAAGASASGLNPRGGGLGALFAPFGLRFTSLASSYVQIFPLFLSSCSLAVSGWIR